ncbi:Adenylosuccinate synthetase [Clarias magur]|uniref:Adenylosuccinate synthetase n=1 Tax=Clarias magur TaxID=1594786 RepID=A0A8J4UAQ8_CLAMG|nr:Adenylosuccinate synthetase [Clarias magur]
MMPLLACHCANTAERAAHVPLRKALGLQPAPRARVAMRPCDWPRPAAWLRRAVTGSDSAVPTIPLWEKLCLRFWSQRREREDVASPLEEMAQHGKRKSTFSTALHHEADTEKNVAIP